MKSHKLIILIMSVISIFLISIFLMFIYLLFFYDDSPDEYKKYDRGVTIEVNNMSNQTLPELNFLYTDDIEVGTIKDLKPGETIKLSGSSKEIKFSDVSLYLNYCINNGEKKVDSLAYMYYKKPYKVVVIINVIGIDKNGLLEYEWKGYNDWSKFGPEIMK
ncbi:hypothetical protein H9650_00265 [Psychrobacillus sp. Sa2BUA9]|uniref:DUF4178 domain-containing protein n=1 Tax=Psychrobacillus faecigallinarum TaxID=2762235 RepID=A0ABR8R421_9BACI|nr:hypothetical protein [Psychrobacillus faecigallinarum]MBD7942542.1 hypothetical protein [Psychrobacillus faecigallinarum]